MAPFNNLNVRIAMQEAIDLPTLASTYYYGTTQHGLPHLPQITWGGDSHIINGRHT